MDQRPKEDGAGNEDGLRGTEEEGGQEELDRFLNQQHLTDTKLKITQTCVGKGSLVTINIKTIIAKNVSLISHAIIYTVCFQMLVTFFTT